MAGSGTHADASAWDPIWASARSWSGWIVWSEGIDEGALTFAFRPLWQLDEPARAALALSRAQATQVYAGLKLWPDALVARLAEAQLVADGTYPNAAVVFAEQGTAAPAIAPVVDYAPSQPRDACCEKGGRSGRRRQLHFRHNDWRYHLQW